MQVAMQLKQLLRIAGHDFPQHNLLKPENMSRNLGRQYCAISTPLPLRKSGFRRAQVQPGSLPRNPLSISPFERSDEQLVNPGQRVDHAMKNRFVTVAGGAFSRPLWQAGSMCQGQHRGKRTRGSNCSSHADILHGAGICCTR
jgi:hypothetical protein